MRKYAISTNRILTYRDQCFAELNLILLNMRKDFDFSHPSFSIRSMTLTASNPRIDRGKSVPGSHIHSSHLSLCTSSVINNSPPSEPPTASLVADFPPSVNLETNIPKREDEGESFAVQAGRVYDMVSDFFSHPTSSSLGSSKQHRRHHQHSRRQTIRQKPTYS